MFKGTLLCISKNGLREVLVQELHGGPMASNFGFEKTCFIVEATYSAAAGVASSHRRSRSLSLSRAGVRISGVKEDREQQRRSREVRNRALGSREC